MYLCVPSVPAHSTWPVVATIAGFVVELCVTSVLSSSRLIMQVRALGARVRFLFLYILLTLKY